MIVLGWIVIFTVSLGVLVKSADIFTEMAEKVGFALRMPSFIIGGTIVAFGTSIPELVSSIIGIYKGASEIVISNVIGSNITNITLILGIAAIVSKKGKINIFREIIEVDLPIMIGSIMLLFAVTWDGKFTRFDGLLLLLGLIIYTLYTIYDERKDIAVPEEAKEDIKHHRINAKVIGLLIGSGIAIYLGAYYTVESVIKLSQIINIGADIIALYAIALGTSLPELAVSIVSVRNGKGEMAVGNILGSNIFNIFAVAGIPGILVSSLYISKSMITTYIPFAFVISLLFFFVAQDKKLTKWEGGILLLFYIFFLSIFK